MKKRVLSLLLALAMLAALAGCGGGDAAAQNEGQASGGPAEGSQAAAEATPEPTPEPVYRLTGASRYAEGELTAQYELTYAAAGDSLPSEVRETRPDAGYETSYTYLADGRVLTRDMEGDASTSRMDSYFDESGKLVWQAEVMQGRYYDENNEPAGWYTDREYSDYTYDEADQLIAVTTVGGSGERRAAREYTYTEGQRTGETATYYYQDYDPDSSSPILVEDVTEYTYAYDAEGRQTRIETYRDGEMTSAVDYTYAGPMRLASYASGSVSAALLDGAGYQLLSVSVSAEAGEPAVQYDGAGCPVRIEAGEGDYAEFTYEPYAPEPMAGEEAPAAVKMDAVMLEDECGTLALKGYMPPYAVMEFTNRCESRAYLSVQSVALNGVGVTGFEFRTALTDPGQTTQCVLQLDPEKLARFGIGQVRTIDAYASVWQEDGDSYSSSPGETALSAELPALTEAEEPAVTEPAFSREPVTVADTDEYKITLADAVLEDGQLRLTVQYENYTGRYMELSVRGLTVNETELTVPEYGNTLGQSYWDSGFMEDTVGYVDEDDMFVTDLGSIIDRTGPIQSVDVTLSVYLQAEKGYEEPRLCPPVTVTF